MIDFFIYYGNNTNYNIDSDWQVIKHVQDYKNKFNNMYQLFSFVSEIDTAIANGEFSAPPGYNDFKSIFYNRINNYIHNIVIETSELTDQSWDARLQTDPALISEYGNFAKAVTYLDNNSENFMSYYSMAQQVKKYICIVGDLFRYVTKMTRGIKSGSIMYYFDNLVNNLNDDFYNFYFYVTDSNSLEDRCNRIADAWVNNYDLSGTTNDSFSSIFISFDSNFKNGLIDFNKLIDACDQYYEDIQLGIKIISAVNLAFFSDDADDNMLKDNARDNFQFLNLDNSDLTGTTTSKVLRLNRSIKGVSAGVVAAIDAKPKINDTKSNMNTLILAVINNIFDYMNITEGFNNTKSILDTQTEPA